MQKFPHNFVWYELLTTDAEAAKAFYRHVMGWNMQDAGMTGSYSILSVGSRGVGGLMEMPEEAIAAGTKPGWMGYIWVNELDEVDSFAAKTVEAGGTIIRPAEDIPVVGRCAVVADPQGAPFVLFKGFPPEEMPPPIPYGIPGFVGWNGLLTSDAEAAFAFYSKLFGWTKTTPMDLGPRGIYQTFATDKDWVGGMLTEAGTPPCWMYSFVVDAIDAAAERVREKGGELMGEIQHVTSLWTVRCRDPQGARFSLTAAKR